MFCHYILPQSPRFISSAPQLLQRMIRRKATVCVLKKRANVRKAICGVPIKAVLCITILGNESVGSNEWISQLNDSPAQGGGYCLSSVVRSQLRENIADVHLDRILRNEESLSNFLV